VKSTHATIYTADDGTEYTDARLCLAHEQVLVKGEHAYGTMGFEAARDALAATWLENLPLLKPTDVVDGREARIHRLPPTPDRWKIRSKTYTGIARAMAEQWSNL